MSFCEPKTKNPRFRIAYKEELRIMESIRNMQEIHLQGVKIIAVTSPNRIAEIAEAKGINPQNVYVKVTFEYEGDTSTSSNQLRFFRQEGYERLLKAKDEGTLVNITLNVDEKGSFMYLDSDKQATVADLFSQPLEDNRKSLADLLGLKF